MRCNNCHEDTSRYVWLVKPGLDKPVPVCYDDRTCEAIAEKRRKIQSPKMVKVRELAERFAS